MMTGFIRRVFTALTGVRSGDRAGRPPTADPFVLRLPIPSASAPPVPPVPVLEPPVDPWRERWAQLETMLRDLDAALGPNPPVPTRRVLFFSTMPAWTDLSLITAVVLAGRGCHVDFAWTPYPDIEDRPIAANEWARLTASGPGAAHPRFRVINLLRVQPAVATPEMRAEAEASAYTDAQYVTRREEIDLAPGTPARAAFEFRLARNLATMTALAALAAEHRYDGMITPSGWVLEFGAAYRLARLVGLPCATLEIHDRRNFIHAGQTVPVLCQDNAAAWRADEPHEYSSKRDLRVQHILSGRKSGDWAEYIIRCQTTRPAPVEELLQQFGLDPEKRVALLCANVAHDSVVLGRSDVFTSHSDWIRRTIDLFARRADWQLLIRAHPAERLMEPDESVESAVREHCAGPLPPNVRLILPDNPVNTYALMSMAHIGLVHSSTAGLEMAASGLPVVVAGMAHYAGKGFTGDPRTPDEYTTIVEEFMSGPARTAPRVIELARCYLDLYFNALPFPFPWVIGQPDDLLTWPVGRVLSPEGEARFGRTFDFLAGLSVPIDSRLQAIAE